MHKHKVSISPFFLSAMAMAFRLKKTWKLQGHMSHVGHVSHGHGHISKHCKHPTLTVNIINNKPEEGGGWLFIQNTQAGSKGVPAVGSLYKLHILCKLSRQESGKIPA